MCFSLLAKSFSDNFSWFGARSTIQLVRSALLSSPLTTPSRAYSLPFSLTVLLFSFRTLSCLFLSLSTFTFICCISPFYCVFVGFFKRAKINSKPFVVQKSIAYVEPLASLSSFILPASLSCSHRQSFFCDFLHWLRSSLRRNNATLRMYLPYARESHRVFYILHERVPRSANESNCYFTIAELHRSDTCELHIIFVSFECRFIPHRTPIALKRVLVLR